MTAGLSCELYVDGHRLADTGVEYADSVPTALAGLKVSWGRSTVIDQPDTTTCSFTVRDKDGDADFLGLLHTGHPVTVRAAGDISTGDDPVDVAVDGWFETTTPTQRVYIDAAGTLAATDDAYSGNRALRIGAFTPDTAFIGPAPFSAAVDAWDDIPKTAAGQQWTVRLMVKPAAAARTSVAPWLPTSPARGPAGTRLPGTAQPAGDWAEYTHTWTVAAADPPGTWVGAALTLDQHMPWTTWPGTWAEQTLTWQDLGTAVVDQLEVLAPPAAQRHVLVFSGRITNLQASPADPTGVQVAVNAVDWTADLANDNIGDNPWPAEVLNARVVRILRLAATPVTTTIAPFPSAQRVSWVDIDSQPVMDLLSDLAVTADAVLWSAWTPSRGFYLWWEDPALRTALRLLAVDPDTGLITIVGNPSPSDGIYLSACQIARDPIRLTQDVTDVLTRVDLTWQEQTLERRRAASADGPAHHRRRRRSRNRVRGAPRRLLHPTDHPARRSGRREPGPEPLQGRGLEVRRIHLGHPHSRTVRRHAAQLGVGPARRFETDRRAHRGRPDARLVTHRPRVRRLPRGRHLHVRGWPLDPGHEPFTVRDDRAVRPLGRHAPGLDVGDVRPGHRLVPAARDHHHRHRQAGGCLMATDIRTAYQSAAVALLAAPAEQQTDLAVQLHQLYVQGQAAGLFSANTTGGLPYPLPTDPVAAGADAIQSLAKALDPAWQAPVSYGPNWTALSAYPPKYRVVAGICYLSGSCYNTTGTPSSLATLITLPAAVAPVTDDTNAYQAGAVVSLTPIGAGTWNAAIGYLDVRSSGSIVLHVPGTATNLPICRLDGTFWRVKGT